jgi:GrpB-like predicted nucleotidyltransferase (UPF0157 family)
MSRRIEVVEYDSNWPARLEAEAGILASVFKSGLVGIHHIGSTAVPGLAAKPTIDILCIVKVGTSVPACYGDMQQLGYECRGECLDAIIPGTPGRYYFSKAVHSQHIVHVHVCHEGHFQIAELIGLRDYLRTHSSEAQEYGACKARLAADFAQDNMGYMRGKDALVKALIEKAMEWKAQQVHAPDAPLGAGDA